MSPYELRYGSAPDILHLRPFGAEAYVRVQSHITKVMPRAVRGTMIGYGHTVSNQQGWRILLDTKGTVVTTTDASFDKSLPQSVASRSPSLISNDVIAMEDSSSTAPVPDLPNSLKPAKSRPVTRSVSRQSSTSLSPSISAPAVPPPTTTQTLSPVKQEPPADPIVPDIVKPELSPDPTTTQTATAVTHRRPVGRPPRGQRWDPYAGKYVPALSASSVPSLSAVWSLVARKVPPDTPLTYHEAISGPDAKHWLKAIEDELACLRRRGTWKAVSVASLPRGAKCIKTKWVFKVKRDAEGRITRYKARLVVCGYAQKFGRDFDETYAPVASSVSIRSLFALASAQELQLSQHDIDLAFLYGVLPEHQRVYLHKPEGVELPEGQCLMLLLALYGLKQAPRLFNLHLKGVLAKIGYTQSLSDPCVYHMRRGSDFSVIAVVVDDILHAASSSSIIDKFATSMSSVYSLKNLGVPSLMVGIHVTATARSIKLNQSHYIRQIADTFRQLDAAPVDTPASQHGCLGDSPNHDSELLDTTSFPYMSLVGSLLWCTITRPDISTAVSRACRHSKSPTLAHWRAAIRILRYLLSTSDFSITYPIHRRPVTVYAYADAAYGNEPGKRSRHGHAVFLSDCIVSWLTKATNAVCLSTAESEFVAATEAAKDVVWLRNFVTELGFPQLAPSRLLEDNQACVAMVNNHSVTGRNRHFCLKMAWLRQQVSDEIIKLVFVASKNNVADILTKILPPAVHAKLTKLLLRLKVVSSRGEC